MRLKITEANLAEEATLTRRLREDLVNAVALANNRLEHIDTLTSIGELMLECHAGDRIEIFELMKWYIEQIKANIVDHLPSRWWAYGIYRNGAAITKQYRHAYRNYATLRSRFPDPFRAEPEWFS